MKDIFIINSRQYSPVIVAKVSQITVYRPVISSSSSEMSKVQNHNFEDNLAILIFRKMVEQIVEENFGAFTPRYHL